MITLILGEPDSGKSALAEKLVCKMASSLPDSCQKIYLATMILYGKEGEKRVQKHRRQREGKGFSTIECPGDLPQVKDEIQQHSPCICLLECMSNLVGNELQAHKEEGDDTILSIMMEELSLLSCSCTHLCIVSNEFPLMEEGYDEETIRYVQLVHRINEKLMNFCDKIYHYENGQWKELT